MTNCTKTSANTRIGSRKHESKSKITSVSKMSKIRKYRNKEKSSIKRRVKNCDLTAVAFQKFLSSAFFTKEKYLFCENTDIKIGFTGLFTLGGLRSEERRVGKECRFRWWV